MLLNVHSNYSLQYGTIAISDLVNNLILNGYESAVLTDINNTSAVLDFMRDCQSKSFHGLAGVEFRNEDELLFIAIARNNAGFREINEFLTEHNRLKIPFPKLAPVWNQVYVVYPFRSEGKDLRENEFMGIRPKELNKLYAKSKAFIEKLVVLSPVSFLQAEDFELHCQLSAIKHNALLSQLKDHQKAGAEELLQPVDSLISQYRAYPKIIINTFTLLDSCRFDFEFESCKSKMTFTASRYNDKLLLEKYAMEGCSLRYGKGNVKALERVRMELEVIDKLGFSAYFLISHDVISYSLRRGFYHVGRGSGANSIVAYCLRITDVCPIELDLYFERFLNPKRKSPPDFDLDFSWKDRDEIFDYIFKRYDPKHTALIGAMTTFQDRSIIRELGKIYGLPKREIDLMIEAPDAIIHQHPIAKKILGTFEKIADFPHNRTIHAGGVLISELPLSEYTALDLPPKGLLTTQFDMYTAEAIGFEKLDILSQRGIGHIGEAVDIIRRNTGKQVDIHQIGAIKKDPKVAEQLKKGDSIGCFYIESPAMRGILKKLHCSDYLTLVAASSIIRPGVGSSGMMDEYIRRFHKPEDVQYLHPVLKEQLSETFGVMIYQEDVLKVAHHYAGLDLAEADVLRRLMSGKNRGAHHLKDIQEKFFSKSKELGRPEEITMELWRQISSFAGYSFSKAHSASYAVESYQSLFLKAWYPNEFMVAVLNNEGGFYSRWLYVAESRKSGARVHLPCVNNSEWVTSIQGVEIYLGLNMVQKLEIKLAEQIIKNRKEHGAFESLDEFVERTGVTLEQLIILIRSGAMRFTGKNKKSLMWLANVLFEKRNRQKTKIANGRMLLRQASREINIPAFPVFEEEDFFDEMEFLQFSVSLSPFHMLKTSFRGEIPASELLNYVGRTVKLLGLYVTMKPTRTKKGETMAFGTFLDAQGDFFDTVHFPSCLREYPFQKSGLYLILGRVTESFGFPTVTVEKMAKLPIRPDPRFVD